MKKNHRKLAKFILAATATSTIASFGVGARIVWILTSRILG